MPPKKPVIDGSEGGRLALKGRIVTMDASDTVVPQGTIYINQGSIMAIRDASAPPPPEFQDTPVVATGCTIFPGLIELHNHLSYNALRLWDVPKKYTNRNQWGGTPTYRKLISGPMTVLGKSPDLLPAVVRYVEMKCLLGGVTTSQGIELFSNAGSRRYYRGIVRNVEQTDEADLPEATAKIADIEASVASLFLARLKKQSCFLLHLSEGTDQAARNHFLALHLSQDQWAITPALAGIHCAALQPEDFSILAEKGGAMVWSPFSNLLLYGATADVAAAKSAGVRIGLGSDWSPSGSKNLLGELKVARIVSANNGGIFTDRDIVALATRGAAEILSWSKLLGSLEVGKKADLLSIAGTAGDPYGALLGAKESDIHLVLINGIPRYGSSALMSSLGTPGESIQVGAESRVINLVQQTEDPSVSAISLAQARDTLTSALKTLPSLAKKLEKPVALARLAASVRKRTGKPLPLVWSLVLDEIEETGMELRPRLPLPGWKGLTGPPHVMAAASAPLSSILEPLDLDPLTVVDDPNFLPLVAREKNLPAYLAPALEALYR